VIDPLRHLPPELREGLVHVTLFGRTFCFETNPEASAEDNLRQVMDSFRKLLFPDPVGGCAVQLPEGWVLTHPRALDQDTADKVAEIFRTQIAHIWRRHGV
jgi:hypothetical protein